MIHLRVNAIYNIVFKIPRRSLNYSNAEVLETQGNAFRTCDKAARTFKEIPCDNLLITDRNIERLLSTC